MIRVIVGVLVLAAASPALAWEKDGLRLRGQLLVRYQVEDETANLGRWADTLDLFRARFDSRWRATDDLSLSLEVELTGEPEVKDAFVRYRVARALRLSAGQMKKPFSRLRMTRRWDLTIPRRGLLDRHIVGRGPFGGFGGRDPGVMISGRVGEKSLRFRYFLGVFVGLDVNDAFFREPGASANEPNASHRDYVGRAQLRIFKGFTVGLSLNHKRANVLLSPGTEKDSSWTLGQADLRWRLGDLRLSVEGVWGENPRAVDGHTLLGGHGTISYAWRIGEEWVLTPAFMVEGLDPDDAIDGGAATRIAGAVNLAIGEHIRLMVAAEGGLDAQRWAEPEYLTEDNMQPQRVSRSLAKRVLVQLGVAI